MNKITAFSRKNWKYILVALIALVIGSTAGPSEDDLAAANKKTDDVKVELQQAKEMNATLTEEKDKLISENEKLQTQVDEASFWLELSDEQKQQVEAYMKAEEEKAKAEAEAKAKAEAEAKAKAEAEAKTEAAEQTQASNNNHAVNSSSSNVVSTGPTVYTTPSGKRYHLDPECGGKNSSANSKDSATARGLTPCQKCAQ